MCTEVSETYLETVHHEMGHVEYFMAYAHQPTVFRDGANCAFHEALGDTIALSVLSRTHLRRLGLESEELIDKRSKTTYCDQKHFAARFSSSYHIRMGLIIFFF